MLKSYYAYSKNQISFYKNQTTILENEINKLNKDPHIVVYNKMYKWGYFEYSKYKKSTIIAMIRKLLNLNERLNHPYSKSKIRSYVATVQELDTKIYGLEMDKSTKEKVLSTIEKAVEDIRPYIG